jgi:D-sedoheptulose 7-phosphate isomerase
MQRIHKIISESIEVKTQILQDVALQGQIWRAAQAMVSTLRAGGKILLCGNGGSAADAQHIAAELSCRFQRERQAFFAEALHVNTSFLTAASNDYGFEHAYARMVQAAGRSGDVLIAISTSGKSPNILKAAQAARDGDLYVISLTGNDGGKLAGIADLDLCMPSKVTARIQEAHILVGHILCELVESELAAQE